MAAGQGFKTFTTGEVLTAGDVNGYLMQGINVFTNATARDAAITAPAEGQFAFTKDNNSLWYYDGAAWVASGATGDIEGVTAGVGISGGGTSGTVTVTNSMATAIDAKGDLVPGTGADTFSRLAVGANNTVLTADSTTATGLKWATPSSGSMTVLASGSLSGSAVNLTSISQDYLTLYLVIRNQNITSAGQVPNFRINNDSSGIYDAKQSSVSGYQVNATDTSWLIGPGNYATTGGNNSFALTFNDYTSASWKIGSGVNIFTENAGGYGLGLWRYAARTTSAITEINMFMTSGNFSGTYILYGVK